LLKQLARERAALSELTETLEERVNDRTAELMSEVAAREKAQARLVQSQKMETIGQLTGGVAHDFNNLLMAVMGNLDLLRKRLSDDPRAQRLISGALQGAQRGAALTQRMLAFARQQDLQTGSADLTALIAGMRDLLDRTLGPQVVLTLDLPDNLPPANVDPNQIELAVLNLAINARDAMPDGGTIHIALEREKSSESKDGTCLLLSVTDNGSGMDEQTLQKAIEPFFSTKPPGKGTGLGLSMVHGLAVQLGGRLQLSSTPGAGTTATLWLPIASVAPAESLKAEQTAAEDRTPVQGATILVVDDDVLIAASAVDMLEDLGHTVIEANSAKQALEIIDQGQEIDLLMTDQAMPGMTGIELAQIVLKKRPKLPILLATGYADLPRSQELGIARLGKPYLQSDLRQHIDRLLASARL
jgi:signal transduction histidine kinase/CheY-like chemotaxis protein